MKKGGCSARCTGPELVFKASSCTFPADASSGVPASGGGARTTGGAFDCKKVALSRDEMLAYGFIPGAVRKRWTSRAAGARGSRGGPGKRQYIALKADLLRVSHRHSSSPL